MDVPDIVYVVRPGEGNRALGLSLRSLANLPHRRVFIAGFIPSWVRNVTAIPVRKTPSKFGSIEMNLRAALRHPELGDRCVYFNDDFYVMQPIDEVPVTHGGPPSEFKLRQEFRWRMDQTVKLLRERRHDEIFSYDGVHMPLPLETSRAREIVRDMPPGILWRTWYGNVARIGGERVANTKTQDGALKEGPFLSTNPTSLAKLWDHLDGVLPRGGPYV